MAAEFRWSKMLLFVMLVLQSTGGNITFSPAYMICKENCSCTAQIFLGSRNPLAWPTGPGLVIETDAQKTLTNQSLTKNCSLVIQLAKGGNSTSLLLSITMTEQKLPDNVTFSCQVFRNDQYTYKVKWTYEGADGGAVITSESGCSANVTVKTSHLYTSRTSEVFSTCVVDASGRALLFAARIQSSGEKAATTADRWWCFVCAAGCFLILLIIVVMLVRRKKPKGDKAQMDMKTGLTFSTAGTQTTPETSQDMADPEDGVSYASVSFTRKTDIKAWVHSKNEDEDDAVTYSTVKVSSSAAADPSSLYASID